MRFSVESWSPEYGIAADDDQLDERGRRGRRRRSSARSTSGRPSRRLRRRRPCGRADRCSSTACGGSTPGSGSTTVTGAHAGVCASVAAGVVVVHGRTGGGRRGRSCPRGLFVAASAGAAPIETRHASYELVPTADDDPASIYLAIHGRMTALEARLAGDLDARGRRLRRTAARAQRPAGGRLREDPARALPARRGRSDPRAPRRRASARRSSSSVGRGLQGLSRYSWYLRLPGPRSAAAGGHRPLRARRARHRRRRGRAGRPPHRDPAAVRQRAAQGAPRPAEPLPDRRPRARPPPPPRRPAPARARAPGHRRRPVLSVAH